MQYKRIIYYN